MSPHGWIARKIKFTVWQQPIFKREDCLIGADVVRDCLKTEDNTLSFWICKKQVSSVDEIVIEIAAHREAFSRVQMILLPYEKFMIMVKARPIYINDNKINTAVRGLENRHVNLENLTISDLPEIADIIADIFRKASKNCKINRTKKKIKEKFYRMVEEGRLVKEQVNYKLIETYNIKFK